MQIKQNTKRVSRMSKLVPGFKIEVFWCRYVMYWVLFPTHLLLLVCNKHRIWIWHITVTSIFYYYFHRHFCFLLTDSSVEWHTAKFPGWKQFTTAAPRTLPSIHGMLALADEPVFFSLTMNPTDQARGSFPKVSVCSEAFASWKTLLPSAYLWFNNVFCNLHWLTNSEDCGPDLHYMHSIIKHTYNLTVSNLTFACL